MLAALLRFSLLLNLLEAIVFGIGCLFVICAKNGRQTRASLLPDAKNAEHKEKTGPSTKTSKQTSTASSKKSSKKTTKTHKSNKSTKKKHEVRTPSLKSSTRPSKRKSKKQKAAVSARKKAKAPIRNHSISKTKRESCCSFCR
ncbi:hypothetical protein M3Y94_00821600 [Aphelenchoides besseyi]|nr:hypothetical protein M3Y94_00821600 [Aphelenchoides besseyi]